MRVAIGLLVLVLAAAVPVAFHVMQKAHDVLRVIDWLKSCGQAEIHLAGKAWGAIPATFAALLSAEHADLWINHDKAQSARVPKAPDYVE